MLLITKICPQLTVPETRLLNLYEYNERQLLIRLR